MYCANCGSLINETLKYCKGCGVRLVRETGNDSANSMFKGLLVAVSLVSVFGFGILIALISVLLKSEVKSEVLVMLTFAYLFVLLGICFMLLKQVPKLIDAKLNQTNQTPELMQPAQISSRSTAQLEEYREPVRSVTENTTRTLEKELVK